MSFGAPGGSGQHLSSDGSGQDLGKPPWCPIFSPMPRSRPAPPRSRYSAPNCCRATRQPGRNCSTASRLAPGDHLLQQPGDACCGWLIGWKTWRSCSAPRVSCRREYVALAQASQTIQAYGFADALGGPEGAGRGAGSAARPHRPAAAASASPMALCGSGCCAAARVTRSSICCPVRPGGA